MPQKIIRIDMEVWEVLKLLAEPLQDTPNDVLRKLLIGELPADDGGYHPQSPYIKDVRPPGDMPYKLLERLMSVYATAYRYDGVRTCRAVRADIREYQRQQGIRP